MKQPVWIVGSALGRHAHTRKWAELRILSVAGIVGDTAKPGLWTLPRKHHSFIASISVLPVHTGWRWSAPITTQPLLPSLTSPKTLKCYSRI